MIRLLVLCVTLLGAVACPSTAPSPTSAPSAQAAYTCPMHPEILRDQPDSCPICGMDLVPAGEAAAAHNHDDGVHISPGMIQQFGVETAVVERTTVFRHLRALGDVEVGENEVGVVNLRVSGWVERLRVERTGEEVRKGQVLFDLYSPELVAAQEELLLAVRTQGEGSELAKASRQRLSLWGVAEADIERVLASKKAQRTLPVRAPRSGFVLTKNVVAGARVEAGRDLYRLGDLRRIWVSAEIYEHDAPWVEVGQPAEMQLTHLPGEVVSGQVAYVYPTLDPSTRTLRVRLEFDNPGIRLKPGMFATVSIEYRRKDDVIAVPSSAVLHTGRRQIVFVSQGRGRFMPREVTLGLTGDRRLTEIIDGLEAGEVVVTSGQFLLDAESQLQEALQKMRSGATDPHEHAPGIVDPDAPWACPMHPEDTGGPGDRCSQCGMNLVQGAAE